MHFPQGPTHTSRQPRPTRGGGEVGGGRWVVDGRWVAKGPGRRGIIVPGLQLLAWNPSSSVEEVKRSAGCLPTRTASATAATTALAIDSLPAFILAFAEDAIFITRAVPGYAINRRPASSVPVLVACCPSFLVVPCQLLECSITSSCSPSKQPKPAIPRVPAHISKGPCLSAFFHPDYIVVSLTWPTLSAQLDSLDLTVANFPILARCGKDRPLRVSLAVWGNKARKSTTTSLAISSFCRTDGDQLAAYIVEQTDAHRGTLARSPRLRPAQQDPN
ncbi:hypothetical protein F4780DRAFT_357558 [Xylariomycetidae sp. FL0641]|nr:hypothetical protein F4780DRAFT_357558 [Xylariomycetidae sp. FL0641]